MEAEPTPCEDGSGVCEPLPPSFVMLRMLRDLRFALRLIAKERWYAAVAVLALALGIGVNATVFTLVNAVLIRGLPFKDSGRL
jgi:hypothetical protein